MPGNPHDMIISAERRFPVRIRIGVPPGGFGQRYAEMTAWLDENCGADGCRGHDRRSLGKPPGLARIEMGLDHHLPIG